MDEIQPKVKKNKNGFGIAGFCVAMASIVLFIVPVFGIIVGAVAAGLSLVGILLAPRKNAGKGLAVAGLVVGLVFLLLACITTSMRSGDTEDKSDTASDSQAQVEVTEEEYKASCQEIDYKDLCRNSDDYKGTNIVITVKVRQVVGTTSHPEWRAYTDTEGWDLYYDDEYYLVDKRGTGAVKILEDDLITVYGEFDGMENVTRAITFSTEEVPKINVKYIDIIE